MPKILAGVPCYNGARTILPQCLEALRKRSGSAYTDFEIVVCDDSGNEGHQIAARQVCERFGARLVVHEKNRGISAAWNTLVRSSDAPFVALFNDDLIVSPGWLEALDYFLANNPHAGCAGFHFDFMVKDDIPRLLADPTAAVLSRHPFSKQLREQTHDPNGLIGLCMCPPGCCFGFARDKFELIGGFDEEYKSFFEESLPGYELVLVKSKRGIHLMSFEQLYREYAQDGESRVSPHEPLYCLSAVVNRDPAAALLTVLEQRIFTGGAHSTADAVTLRRATRKRQEAERIEAVWKPITSIIRHKRHNDIVHVSQKAGSVFVTENHSMVVPEDDGFKVVAPDVFLEKALPRAVTIPLPETRERLDLGSYVDTWDQYRCSDSEIWYMRKNNQSEVSHHPNMESDKVPRWIDLTSKDGEDFCWLVGFHVAEGSTSIVHSNYGMITLAVCANSDMRLIERTMSIWNKTIGVHARVNTSAKESPTGVPYKPVHTIWVSHKLLGLIFRRMCGAGARNKKVPDFIYDAPRACKQAFMDGYAAGDGLEVDAYSDRVEARAILHVETVSRTLAAGLAILFGSLGRHFSIRNRTKTESYVIRTVEQFVGPHDSKKIDPVDDPCEFVYDLEVKDTHVFCAGVGPVVVHNSDFGTALSSRDMGVYLLPWPTFGHLWSATFETAPELEGPKRMDHSRDRYRQKWGGDFTVTDPKYMGAHTQKLTKWMSPEGPKEAMR